MNPKEIYKVVYKTVRKEALKSNCRAVEGHKNFARNLPDPKDVTEEEAAIFSAMVSCSPSNDWGLEGFFQTPLESGKTLGQFVRENLENPMQYAPQMKDLARKCMNF